MIYGRLRLCNIMGGLLIIRRICLGRRLKRFFWEKDGGKGRGGKGRGRTWRQNGETFTGRGGKGLEGRFSI